MMFKMVVRPRSVETPVTWHKLFLTTQWAVCAVAVKVTDGAYEGVAAFPFHTRRKTPSSNQRAPAQEPSKQRVSQIGRNRANNEERKVDLDEIVRDA